MVKSILDEMRANEAAIAAMKEKDAASGADDDEPVDNAMHCKQEISESDDEEWSSDFISDEEEEFDSDMDWD